MTTTEKYLPYILSLTLPSLNIISNNYPYQGLVWYTLAFRYCLITIFIFSLWHIITYFLDTKKNAFSSQSLPIFLPIVISCYILSFTALDYFLLPPTLSLSHFVPYWTVIIRLSMAAVILTTIQYSLKSRKKNALLQIQNLSLQAKNTKAQLEIFKQQINPHFLFNNLNTLIDLIEEDQEKAIEFVHHFSSLYRFVLQSSKRDLVLVEEEIIFLNSYWELLKTRFSSGIQLSVHISESVKKKMVPSFSLQLLIENAVKHNEILAGNPLVIDIFDTDNCIQIENKIIPKAYLGNSVGVGLRNLQHRFLFLLGKEIEFGIRNNRFIVSLPLK